MAKVSFIYQHSLLLEWRNYSSTALTFLCLSYRTICPILQVKLQFRLLPLHRCQVIVAESQIWRKRLMWKQIEVQFMQYCHRYDRFVTRCVILVKEHLFCIHWGRFYHTDPEIRTPYPCPPTVTFLVTLVGFLLSTSTQLAVDFTLEYSDGSIFHQLPYYIH